MILPDQLTQLGQPNWSASQLIKRVSYIPVEKN
jgi:hypothetical protein